MNNRPDVAWLASGYVATKQVFVPTVLRSWNAYFTQLMRRLWSCFGLGEGLLERIGFWIL